MAAAQRLQAALQAWRDCEAEGWTISAVRLPPLLPRICMRVPQAMASPQAARQLDDYFGFVGHRGRTIPFFACLDLGGAPDGRVHFLPFWRAFSEAARLAAEATASSGGGAAEAHRASRPTLGGGGGSGGGAEGSVRRRRERLAGELERLRDALLAAAAASTAPGHVPAEEALAAVRAAGRASATVSVWRGLEQALEEFDRELLGFEDLAFWLEPWLLAAVSSRPLEQPPQQNASRLRELGRAAGSMREVSAVHPQAREVDVVQGKCFGCWADSDAPGLPVSLHVYDVSHEDGLRRLNKVLAHRRAPVKLGGIFHAGIEVAGLEWSYGYAPGRTATGVSSGAPRANPDHHFRQTVGLGRTQLSAEEVAQVLTELSAEYRGKDYDVLHRNCLHFADDLARRLGTRRVPRWVHRFARVGARLDHLLENSPALRDRLFSKLLGDWDSAAF